jgi:hypothetical protein
MGEWQALWTTQRALSQARSARKGVAEHGLAARHIGTTLSLFQTYATPAVLYAS